MGWGGGGGGGARFSYVVFFIFSFCISLVIGAMFCLLSVQVVDDDLCYELITSLKLKIENGKNCLKTVKN